MTLPHASRRSSVLAAAAILISLGALHAWSLLRFPAPFVDEAWIASRGWALVTRGEMTGTLDRGVIDQFPQGWSFFPVLPTLVDACVMALAGAPSILALRLVSLAGGAALAYAMWSIARHLVGCGAAWLAVVLLTLSSPFVYSSHLARSDVLAAAMGYGGVALFLAAGHQRAWLAGLGGLSASLALDMHPFAIVIAAALPVLAVTEFGASLHRFAVCRAMLAGLAAGAVFWAGVHVWPDAQGYLTLTRVFFGPTHPPSSFREWLNGPFDTLLLLWDSYLVALPPVLWAVVSLARSTRHADRMLAILAACVFVAFSLLVRNKLHYYAILITPAFSLCLAAAISRTFESRRTSPAFSLAVLAVCAVLLIKSFSLSMRFLESDSYAAYRRVQERLGDPSPLENASWRLRPGGSACTITSISRGNSSCFCSDSARSRRSPTG